MVEYGVPDLDIPPIVDLVEHGERGYDIDPEHPEACLCGQFSDYMHCPDHGQLGFMTLEMVDGQIELRP
jgi:hypothetical protein